MSLFLSTIFSYYVVYLFTYQRFCMQKKIEKKKNEIYANIIKSL